MTIEDLIICFQDTLKISEGELIEKTRTSINSNRVYSEGFISKKRQDKENERASITVLEGTTFASAKKYCQYGRVAVLNFANPEYPGGGVGNGAMAQEECLCRSSNLYACISNENVFDDYYAYHRGLNNHFYSDRLIYTKDIVVFKNDYAMPELMPENEWFEVDVITCAAPYLGQRKYTNEKALKELFKGRIRNIFEAAIDNEADVLILGAFGCGAFKNPPRVVAEAFYETIIENNYDKCFNQIVFAIKSTNNDDPFEPCPNILAFESRFFWDNNLGLDAHILTSEIGKLRWVDNYPLVQVAGTIELPNGKVLNGGEEFNPFLKWREENRYCGKQFSILGDSISTLDGYNPRGYNVFYYGNNCRKAGIKDYTDTWWGMVLKFFGGELLVNNSWSGSRVSRLPNNERLFPSGCSDERTAALHINNVTPDVILVYLGTNDWGYGAEVRDAGVETRVIQRESCFDDAYEIMLDKIMANYPNAEIWCCTLCETYISGDPDFKFPHTFAGIHIEKYNEIIRRIVKIKGCKLIDLYGTNVPYDSIDGSHPNKVGMQTIATAVCMAMADDVGRQFLELDNNSWWSRIAKKIKSFKSK